MQKWWALPVDERRLFRQAYFLLLGSVIGLRLFGFQRWQRWFNRPITTKTPPNFERAEQIAQTVRRAAYHQPMKAMCLPQSIVLSRLLAQNDVVHELRIGVQKKDGQFHAHAWVECDGRPVLQAETLQDDFIMFDKSFSG